MDDHSETLTVGDVEYRLRPTPNAMRAINRHCTGYGAGLTRVGGLDVDAMATIIALGADLDRPRRKKLDDAIYSVDCVDLVDPIAKFLSTCMNGGKRRVASGDDDGDDDEGARGNG